MIPIIDTHQHLWDLTIFHLPWQKGNPKLARSFVMRDYLEATAGLNVVKSIYMEVDVEPSQQPAEADHVIAICQRGDTPMAAAVISGRPAGEGFKDYIIRYKQSPFIKGVRQVLHVPETPPGYCLDDRFIRGIRLLGTLGLSFDICCRSTDLRDAAKLIDACPDTRFILDHCGNASVRTRDRRLADRHRRRGPAAERRVQGLGHRGLGRARPLDGRRPRPDHQPRPRHLRPRPRHVRRRLARLHPGRDLPPVDRGPSGDRRHPEPGRPAQAVPRQRGQVLWAFVG